MPARAPASIDMLQTVRRPSIDSARIVAPAYSITWPMAPAAPISADDREDDVLGRDARRRGAPSTVMRMRAAACAATASASPARAPLRSRRCRRPARRARRASRCGCRRRRSACPAGSGPAPGRRRARCPGARSSRPKKRMPARGAVVAQRLRHARASRDRRCRPSVAAVGRHVVVGRGEGALRGARPRGRAGAASRRPAPSRPGPGGGRRRAGSGRRRARMIACARPDLVEQRLWCLPRFHCLIRSTCF